MTESDGKEDTKKHIFVRQKQRNAPTWSSLRTLGQSPLMKLTILAPFLGWIVLFNDQVIQFLSVSPEVIDNWLTGKEVSQNAKPFTVGRLIYAYMGLSILGLAAGAFSLMCPEEIKRSASRREFRAEGQNSTATQAMILLQQAAESHLFAVTSRRVRTKFAYPKELIFHWNMLCDQMVLQIDASFAGGRRTADAGLRERVPGRERGEQVSIIVLRADTELAREFKDKALAFCGDLLDLRFEARDHSNPAARAAIFIGYALGFTILLIPTAQTFFNVIRRLVGW